MAKPKILNDEQIIRAKKAILNPNIPEETRDAIQASIDLTVADLRSKAAEIRKRGVTPEDIGYENTRLGPIERLTKGMSDVSQSFRDIPESPDIASAKSANEAQMMGAVRKGQLAAPVGKAGSLALDVMGTVGAVAAELPKMGSDKAYAAGLPKVGLALDLAGDAADIAAGGGVRKGLSAVKNQADIGFTTYNAMQKKASGLVDEAWDYLKQAKGLERQDRVNALSQFADKMYDVGKKVYNSVFNTEVGDVAREAWVAKNRPWMTKVQPALKKMGEVELDGFYRKADELIAKQPELASRKAEIIKKLKEQMEGARYTDDATFKFEGLDNRRKLPDQTITTQARDARSTVGGQTINTKGQSYDQVDAAQIDPVYGNVSKTKVEIPASSRTTPTQEVGEYIPESSRTVKGKTVGEKIAPSERTVSGQKIVQTSMPAERFYANRMAMDDFIGSFGPETQQSMRSVAKDLREYMRKELETKALQNNAPEFLDGMKKEHEILNTIEKMGLSENSNKEQFIKRLFSVNSKERQEGIDALNELMPELNLKNDAYLAWMANNLKPDDFKKIASSTRSDLTYGVSEIPSKVISGTPPRKGDMRFARDVGAGDGEATLSRLLQVPGLTPTQRVALTDFLEKGSGAIGLSAEALKLGVTGSALKTIMGIEKRKEMDRQNNP